MLALIRTFVRAFVLGFVVGVLLAPRPGRETRRLLREKFEAVVGQLLDIGGLPPIVTDDAAGSGRRPRSAGESSARATSA